MAICDRGYRGKRRIGDTRIEIPESGKDAKTEHNKRQARARFCRRAAIEPIIGHLKNDHRMLRNYLKGRIGDSVNLFMACAAFNFRKFIRILYFCASNYLGTFFDQMFGRYSLVPDGLILEFFRTDYLIYWFKVLKFTRSPLM